MNNKKYQVIYADPPWQYRFSKSKNRDIQNHYPTMSLHDICRLDISSITDNNCVLYLWATAPKLVEALNVISAWGFKYKSQLVWDKSKIGMGYWFRGQHEILLIATKGRISPPCPKDRIASIFREKRTKHSKKPDFIRNYIESIFTDSNKVELFAREKSQGWDVWGNEVDSDIKFI